MNVGCAGKTVEIPWERVPYLSALEVCSRQGWRCYTTPRLPYLTLRYLSADTLSDLGPLLMAVHMVLCFYIIIVIINVSIK